MALPPDRLDRPKIEVRTIAEGKGWRVSDFVCRAGPEDRKFEEEHDTVAIAAVVAGTFVYKGSTGRHLLHPGALLLGNHGTCFECGHDHSRGDRCIGFQFAPELFEEIAASAGGGSHFRFSTAMIPAGGALAGTVASAVAASIDPQAAEDCIVQLAEVVVAHMSDALPTDQKVTARDEARISAALRWLEADYAETIDIDALANAAGMTKYHFIRTFRRVVGVTPYQFVLETRLREVAVRLVRTEVPVSAAALDAGFGDLSTFNARFRDRFGLTPSDYRARHARPIRASRRRSVSTL